ncbi:3882_t:CDS:1, partial [Racocetra persica]
LEKSVDETHLTWEQKREAENFLNIKKAIFARDTNDISQTNLMIHEINTGSATPIKQTPYRAAPSVREFIRKEVERLKEKCLIKESKSPWASPIVVVPKKGGKLRMCVDYRKLNAVTKKDAFPLPRIDELLEVFGCASWFSTLDLMSGYWQ